MLVPDLLGGSGSLGQPSFFASYNLAEVTGYVGVLPLVAAAVLLGRFRLRPRPPEWIVWHAIALVGVVLALGGNTPARAPARPPALVRWAAAAEPQHPGDGPGPGRPARLLGRPAPRRAGSAVLRARGWRRIDLETVLGVLPPLAMIAVVVLGLCWGAGLLRWLGAGPGAAGVDGRLKPWLVPYAVMGAGAIAFVIFGRRLRPRPRARWLASFVVIDLVVFTSSAWSRSMPGLGRAAPASSPAPRRPAGLFRAAAAGRRPRARSPPSGYPGRFAIYDPDELDARQLPRSAHPISTRSAPRHRSRGTRRSSTAAMPR